MADAKVLVFRTRADATAGLPGANVIVGVRASSAAAMKANQCSPVAMPGGGSQNQEGTAAFCRLT